MFINKKLVTILLEITLLVNDKSNKRLNLSKILQISG
ncbi:hypothetical protein MHA_0675 [Mannheimia haemolytica PHL213]|nr:hypothetical protein MHA_0675 [Mannheimia haemolytica PHL213]